MIKYLLLSLSAGSLILGALAVGQGKIRSVSHPMIQHQVAAPTPPAPRLKRFYLEAGTGYVFSNLNQAHPLLKGDVANITKTTNDKGGLGLIGTVGFQINQNLGLEANYMRLMQNYENFVVSGSTTGNQQVGQDSITGLLKFSIGDLGLSGIVLYLKGGVSYTRFKVSYNGTISHTGDAKTYTALGFAGGGGLSYNILDNIYLNVQYMKLAGFNDTSQGIPGPAYAMASLGVRF